MSFSIISFHQNIWVYQPNAVLNFLDEIILLKLFHNLRDSWLAYSNAFGDMFVSADKGIICLLSVLDYEDKYIKLFAINDT